MDQFSFAVEKTHGLARVAQFTTPHGTVKTPIFMPVGTQASVKALDTRDLIDSKAQIILANTYHLYLRPGTETLQAVGGLHNFMNWSGPILTDSGGFQVFSLGLQKEQKSEVSSVKIQEDGVEFKSHLDGTKHFFTPEKAIEIQRQIGADIIMAFDECTPDTATAQYTREALDRTHRWAEQCKIYWEEHKRQSVYGKYQALFGIIQGAQHRDLREESARTIASTGFDGIAVGGETIGYNMSKTLEILEWIRPFLPKDKPLYCMGIGRDPQNIVDAVLAGVDMFDCVAPTRLARNGALYHGYLDTKDKQPNFVSEYVKGRLNIGNEQFSQDHQPVQKDCDCSTCSAGYSRAYLRHLYKTKELSYYRLASIHNVRFMTRLTEQLRAYF